MAMVARLLQYVVAVISQEVPHRLLFLIAEDRVHLFENSLKIFYFYFPIVGLLLSDVLFSIDFLDLV